MVGTNVGDVHRQRQGTGLATTFGKDTTDEYYLQYSKGLADERKRQAAAKKAAEKEVIEKINSINPDFFFKHKEEITSMASQLRELGVQKLKQGVDPYSDEEFLRKQAELEAASKVSTQIRDAYKVTQEDIRGKGDPSYFDIGSLKSTYDYYDRPLSEHLANPTQAPILMQRTVLPEVITILKGAADNKGAYNEIGAYDPSSKAASEYARTLITDPEVGSKNLAAINQAIASRPVEFQNSLKQRAQDNGMSPQELFIAEQAQYLSPSAEPFSYTKAFESAISATELSTRERSGAKGFSKKVDKRESYKSALAAARAQLNSDPRAYENTGRVLKVDRDPTDSDADYNKKVEEAFAIEILNAKGKKDASGETMFGYQSREMEDSGNLYIQHFKSGDTRIMQEAANWARGIKLPDGSVIDNFEIVEPGLRPPMITRTKEGPFGETTTTEPMWDATGPIQRGVLFSMAVDPENPYEDVKDKKDIKKIQEMLPDIQDAKAAYDEETGQYKVFVPLNANNDNFIANLHALGANQRKQVYHGVYDEGIRTEAEQNVPAKIPTIEDTKFEPIQQRYKTWK